MSTLSFDIAKATKLLGVTVDTFIIPQSVNGDAPGASEAVGRSVNGMSCVPGLSCAVDTSIIPINSLVAYSNSVWLASDKIETASKTPKISLCFYSTGAAKQFGTKTNQTIYVLKPGDSGYQELYNEYVEYNDLDSLIEDSEGNYTGGSWLWSNYNVSDHYPKIHKMLTAAKKYVSTYKRNAVGLLVSDSSSGETKYASDTSIYKLATVNSQQGTSNYDSKTGEWGVSGIGTGVPGSILNEYGVVDFMSFIQTLAFKDMMQGMYSQNGQWSFHDYISRTMGRFYHQLYYVPNLRNNKVIVVKPETLFVEAPSCNVIYPNMKSTIAYSRPFKQEPSRLIQVTDPVAGLNGGRGASASSLFTIAYLDEKKLPGCDTNAMPAYAINVRGLDDTDFAKGCNEPNATRPILKLTDYERRNGIRTSTIHKGADMYLFMISDYKSARRKNPVTKKTETVKQITVETSSEGGTNIARVLSSLAKYELCRAKYTIRQGSCDMYFNPYIVPGFPMISVENTTTSMNVYGYVTSVVHNLTDRSWSTTVAFNCGHTENEAVPGAFPITEEAYANKILDTYQDMLGDTVIPVHAPAVKELIDSYNNENTYITQSYRKVWRETPTLDDYCKYIADGAIVVEDEGFMWLQNADEATDKTKEAGFFDSELQAAIRDYTSRVLSGKPYAIEDVN